MELAGDASRSSRKTRRLLSGVLFLQAVDAAYNAYSATNSSPQTSDVFGDASRRASLMWYVNAGHVSAVALAVLSSIIAGSLWPLAGFGVIIAQMSWLYRRAFCRAAARAGDQGSAGGSIAAGAKTAGGGTTPLLGFRRPR